MALQSSAMRGQVAEFGGAVDSPVCSPLSTLAAIRGLGCE
eukprot:CAMPEP_0185173778 /NCGR_PEP_ID=MMETSP1139-20130426/24022_1 /TAXON_ID=298111 /ORGANISM="Pavlova sp., Strain CCMP459" /LENGTH=39 /DNA_ID= /DNA_START= /DNA_END= /DNA_ORIENTATION=